MKCIWQIILVANHLPKYVSYFLSMLDIKYHVQLSTKVNMDGLNR